MTGEHSCRPLYDDHGNPIATARVSDDISPAGLAALVEVVEAAKKLHAELDAADTGRVVRREQAHRRLQDRLARWRGETATP